MTSGIKKLLIWSGVVTLVAPMLGLSGTVIGMMSAFQSLGQSGTANMEGLSNAISGVLISTIVGTGIGFISLVVFIVTLVCYLTRSKNP